MRIKRLIWIVFLLVVGIAAYLSRFYDGQTQSFEKNILWVIAVIGLVVISIRDYRKMKQD